MMHVLALSGLPGHVHLTGYTVLVSTLSVEEQPHTSPLIKADPVTHSNIWGMVGPLTPSKLAPGWRPLCRQVQASPCRTASGRTNPVQLGMVQD